MNRCMLAVLAMLTLLAPSLGLSLAPNSLLAQESPKQVQGDRLTGRLFENMRIRNFQWRGPGLPQGSYEMLLEAKPVASELDITKEQLKQFQQIKMDSIPELTRLSDVLRNIPTSKAEERAALSAQIDEVESSRDSAVMAVLSRRQRERLEQIALQQEGPLALARPALAFKLNMSPEQIEAIQEILAEHDLSLQWIQGQRREGPRLVPDPNDPETTKAVWRSVKNLDDLDEAAKEKTVRRILKVLRSRQREKYARLLGKPFDLTALTWGSSIRAEKEAPG